MHRLSRTGGPDRDLRTTARVMHVLNGLGFGGNETLALELVRRIPAEAHLVLNIGADGPMRGAFESLGARVLSLQYDRRGRARFVRELTSLLRAEAPDAVVIGPFGLHVLVAIAARLAGVRNVLARAGNPPPSGGPRRRLWRAIVWASALLRTPIVACSAWVDGELRRLARWMPARSCVVQNGIDIEQVAGRADAARRARGQQGPVVGMIGRLSPIKDQETLIRAVRIVLRTEPGVQLWLVGEGETRPRLERLVADLGLGRAVKFLGWRGDASELLGSMDVCVFSTTRDEGFGIAIVEAMAAGLPVVATDVPPCREVLLDGLAGLLVPPRDPGAMSKALEQLLASPAARSEWSARARTAARQFSIERCAKSWSRLMAGLAP